MIVLENRVNFPTNQIQNLKHLHLGHSRFPALQAFASFHFESSLAYDMMQTFALIGPQDNLLTINWRLLQPSLFNRTGCVDRVR